VLTTLKGLGGGFYVHQTGLHMCGLHGWWRQASWKAAARGLVARVLTEEMGVDGEAWVVGQGMVAALVAKQLPPPGGQLPHPA